MKRLVCLILSLVLLLSCVPAAAAAEAGLQNFRNINTYKPGTFEDISEEAWYAENVAQAYAFGLVKGVSKKRFNPEGSITIAETVALAARLHHIYNGGDGKFKQGDPWYKVYFDYCEKEHMFPASSYPKPEMKAARSTFASILSKALPTSALKAINNIETGKIPDVSGKEQFGPAVYLLYNAGILTGSDKYGTFYPQNTIIRSEVAAIVTRMADPLLRKEVKLKEGGAVPATLDLWDLRRDYHNALDAAVDATDCLDIGKDDPTNFELYLKTKKMVKSNFEVSANYLNGIMNASKGYSEMALLRSLIQQSLDAIAPMVEMDLSKEKPEKAAALQHLVFLGFMGNVVATFDKLVNLMDATDNEFQRLIENQY